MGWLQNFFKKNPEASQDVEASAKVNDKTNKAVKYIFDAIEKDPNTIKNMSDKSLFAIKESLKNNKDGAMNILQHTNQEIQRIQNEIAWAEKIVEVTPTNVSKKKFFHKLLKLKTPEEKETKETTKKIEQLQQDLESLQTIKALAEKNITPEDVEKFIDTRPLQQLVTVPTQADANIEAAKNTPIPVEAPNAVFLKDFTKENILEKVLANNTDRPDIYKFNVSKLSQLPNIISTLTTAINAPEKNDGEIEKIRKLINFLKEWDIAAFQKIVYGDKPVSFLQDQRNDSKIGLETLARTQEYIQQQTIVVASKDELIKEKELKEAIATAPASHEVAGSAREKSEIEQPTLTQKMMKNFDRIFTRKIYKETLAKIEPRWKDKNVDFMIGDLPVKGNLEFIDWGVYVMSKDPQWKDIQYKLNTYEVTPDHITIITTWDTKEYILNTPEWSTDTSIIWLVGIEEIKHTPLSI